MAPGKMHAAVLVVPMPPAVEMRPVRVAVYMASIILAARNMNAAVLMVPMPRAVEMRSVNVAVHVVVPIIVLRLVHDPIPRRSERLQR